MYTIVSDQSKWVFEVQMAAQIQVSKQASKISNRARRVAFDTLDAATERMISAASDTTERARRVSREAEEFLSRTEG